VLFSSQVRVRVKFIVWLVSDYALVFVLISAVIVTLPLPTMDSRVVASTNAFYITVMVYSTAEWVRSEAGT